MLVSYVEGTQYVVKALISLTNTLLDHSTYIDKYIPQLSHTSSKLKVSQIVLTFYLTFQNISSLF